MDPPCLLWFVSYPLETWLKKSVSMNKSEENTPSWLLPKPGVEYPLKVDYCPEFGVPYEYCEYYPGGKEWMEKNMPDKFAELFLAEGGDKKDKDEKEDKEESDEAKKRQKRGGKGQVKTKKKESEVERRVALFIVPRGKKKAVTVVQGLKTCGIDLKVASKFLGQRFACGASITGDDEIVIQGDCKDDLFEVIPEKWPEVDEDCIEDLGERKR